MKRVAGLALCLFLAMPCLAQGASKAGSLAVTPLEDEFAGQSAPLHTPPGSKGTGSGEARVTSGGAGESGVSAPSVPPAPGGKDAIVLAYLIDMARTRSKPCPSGVALPAPPSLMFSEPLCKAAQAVYGGAEPLAAMAGQGVSAAKWRMFSAADVPPQRVVDGLRQSYCEELLEPYTHIGAYRDSGGWRILLATFAARPATGGGAPAPESGGGAGTLPEAGGTARQSQPGTGAPGAAVSPGAVPLAGGAAFAAPSGTGKPNAAAAAVTPGNAPDAGPGQEARSLFILLNGFRVTGGMCSGRALPPAPLLAFDPELQALAETDAATPGGKTPAWDPDALYNGSNMTRLTLTAPGRASVALNVWKGSPSQCEALLSPLFTAVGAAHENGRWVLILGGRNVGVPSSE